jgi:hypothetical protein
VIRDIVGFHGIVGMGEIAELFDVKIGTVHSWRYTGQLPEAEGYLSGAPLWTLACVLEWGHETGRLEIEPVS